MFFIRAPTSTSNMFLIILLTFLTLLINPQNESIFHWVYYFPLKVMILPITPNTVRIMCPTGSSDLPGFLPMTAA